MTIPRMPISLVAMAAMLLFGAVDASAYSSASYKREGLLAQWDAIDNAGNPRIFPRRGVVDVGCYESQQPPATVIFLK